MFYSSGSKDMTNVEPICKFFVSGCWWTVKESKLSQMLRWGGGQGGGGICNGLALHDREVVILLVKKV